MAFVFRSPIFELPIADSAVAALTAALTATSTVTSVAVSRVGGRVTGDVPIKTAFAGGCRRLQASGGGAAPLEQSREGGVPVTEALDRPADTLERAHAVRERSLQLGRYLSEEI